MTLGELQTRIDTVTLSAVAPLSFEQLAIYQQMAFDYMLALCEPLNLVIFYRDSDIARIVRVEEEVYLKAPKIATNSNEFIDIDKRLEVSFVYVICSLILGDKAYKERAYRLLLEYSLEVGDMGYVKAKEVYESRFSFINGVVFDALGRIYRVDKSFRDKTIDTLLCKKVCLNSSFYLQIKAYEKYLKGVFEPQDRLKFEALDLAIFSHLVDSGDVLKYRDEELTRVTSLFCRFSKKEMDEGDKALDKRMEYGMCCEDIQSRPCPMIDGGVVYE